MYVVCDSLVVDRRRIRDDVLLAKRASPVMRLDSADQGQLEETRKAVRGKGLGGGA